jgi:signal peptidase II
MDKSPLYFLPMADMVTCLHGRVVDMFYFPLVQTTWPRWIPIIGGSELSFFQYIFNVADSAISIGVFCILIFNKKFLQAPISSKSDD